VGVEGLHVGGDVAAREDAAVHLRVEGLDATVQHFRKARQLGHVDHGDTGFAEELGRPAR